MQEADAPKRCRLCEAQLSTGEFYKDRHSADGLQAKCKSCCKKLSKMWYDSNPSLHIERSKKRYREKSPHLLKYGLTSDSYAKMLMTQNGVCAICFKTCTNGRRLAVDHDHATGKVRGLLCSRCNLAIGYVNESIEWLRSADEYLSETKSMARGTSTDQPKNDRHIVG